VGILALIVVNSAQLVMPKMTGQLTDMIAEGTFTRAELGRFCLFLVGLAVVIAVFSLPVADQHHGCRPEDGIHPAQHVL